MVGWLEISDCTYSKSTCGANKSTIIMATRLFGFHLKNARKSTRRCASKTVETVESVKTVETVETVKTWETVETEKTEDLKKHRSLKN